MAEATWYPWNTKLKDIIEYERGNYFMKLDYAIRAAYVDKKTQEDNENVVGDIVYNTNLRIMADGISDAIEQAQEILGENYRIYCAEGNPRLVPNYNNPF